MTSFAHLFLILCCIIHSIKFAFQLKAFYTCFDCGSKIDTFLNLTLHLIAGIIVMSIKGDGIRIRALIGLRNKRELLTLATH